MLSPYRLEVLNDHDRGRLLPRRLVPLCDGRPTTIGRVPLSDLHRVCDVQLASIAVSRRHALVWQQGDDVWIKDDNSRSGTCVNGLPIRGATRLYIDNWISVGGVSLRLVCLFDVDPRWLARADGAVVRLARLVAFEKAYHVLPILGDALEEAGCCDEAVLAHCRAGQEHKEGCWVAGQLLGVVPWRADGGQ